MYLSFPVRSLHFDHLDLIQPLPDKSLDWSKLKEFADDKVNVIQNLKYALGRVKIIVAKGENASYQHFLLLTHLNFKRFSFLGLLKVNQHFLFFSIRHINHYLNFI